VEATGVASGEAEVWREREKEREWEWKGVGVKEIKKSDMRVSWLVVEIENER